ncbi:MAG: hypothetical protein IPJ34_38860 [Myxococcales bacterium]|nr:hypothetical protein [Myxococcales bacterium]
MNPGYQQQPQQGYPQQGYQQPAAPAPAAPSGPTDNSIKKNPMLLVAAILFGVFILCGWLVGSFKIDGDGGRFLSHTGFATGISGMGLLLLSAFQRLVEKDKEHPTGVGLGIVISVLITVVAAGSVVLMK